MPKSLQTFLALTAAFTLVIGVVLLLFPDQIVPLFMSRHSDIEQYFFARFLGSTLVGYSVLNWRAQYFTEPKAIHTALLSNLATLSVATVISLNGLITGTLNSKGWLIALMHLSFAVNFGYYLKVLK